MSKISKIVLVSLKEHTNKFFDPTIIEKLLQKRGVQVELVLLEQPTRSQSETVYKGIEKTGVKGAFFVKDCDNYFETEISDTNRVSFVDLHDCGQINAANKSYIQLNEFHNVTNIVEKRIISQFFCCGGYQFNSAEKYCEVYEQLANKLPHTEEIYVSHIIYQMVLNGEIFEAVAGTQFEDFGTIKEYKSLTKKSAVIFCDIDGVLCENGSKFSINGWQTPVIEKNIEALKHLQRNQDIEIIVTTSRPSSEKEALEELLEYHGLQVKQYIMDLPHSQRILVNDFANSNTFPTAHAINIPRNDQRLLEYLNWLDY